MIEYYVALCNGERPPIQIGEVTEDYNECRQRVSYLNGHSDLRASRTCGQYYVAERGVPDYPPTPSWGTTAAVALSAAIVVLVLFWAYCWALP